MNESPAESPAEHAIINSKILKLDNAVIDAVGQSGTAGLSFPPNMQKNTRNSSDRSSREPVGGEG